MWWIKFKRLITRQSNLGEKSDVLRNGRPDFSDRVKLGLVKLLSAMNTTLSVNPIETHSVWTVCLSILVHTMNCLCAFPYRRLPIDLFFPVVFQANVISSARQQRLNSIWTCLYMPGAWRHTFTFWKCANDFCNQNVLLFNCVIHRWWNIIKTL